ncbi:Uncharacterised protein [Vibrio cholerae]|nr:Uncharacterised protein [Vibrio cholerae]CSD19045.1 Uncharacterised protein [Vibrio cholerae]
MGGKIGCSKWYQCKPKWYWAGAKCRKIALSSQEAPFNGTGYKKAF